MAKSKKNTRGQRVSAKGNSERDYDNTIVKQWEDMDVRIKSVIPFSEMLEFVNDVVMSCFQANGGYMPELLDFSIKGNILTRYANFSIPDDLEERYELIYNTDVVDFVCTNINKTQLNEIVNSIDRKIKYMCDSNAMEIQRRFNELISIFENAQAKTAELFNNLSSEDIANLSKAIGGEQVEDKIVASYLSQTKLDEPIAPVLTPDFSGNKA